MSETSNSSSPQIINSAIPIIPTTPDPIVLLNLPISTKLTRTNYLAWKCQIIPLLHGYGLYKYIDPTTIPLSPTILTSTGSIEINPDYLTWRKQDQLLLGWLRSSLSESLLGQTASTSTTVALWDYLQQTFSAASRAQLSALHRKLRTTTKGGLSCSDYIQQMRSTADELSFIGAPVSDEELMRYNSEGLGSKFNPIVVTANAQSEPFSLTDLMSFIFSHENLLQSQLSSLSFLPLPNPTGFYSNPKPVQDSKPVQNPRPIYQMQSQLRPRSTRPHTLVFHPPCNSGPPILPNPPVRPPFPQWALFSPYKHPILSSTGSYQQIVVPPVEKPNRTATCQICSKVGYSANEYWHRNDSRYGSTSGARSVVSLTPPFQAYVALPSNSGADFGWVIDFGATHRVTSDLNNLSHYVQYDGSSTLHIGDGTAMPIQHIGSSSLSFSKFSVELCDILHVPSFTTNLFSLSKLLLDNSLIIEFSSDFCLLKNSLTKIVLLQAPLTNGLYILLSLSLSSQSFLGVKTSVDT